MPGFGLTLGITLGYLGLLVLLPLTTLAVKASGIGWEGFTRVLGSPRVWAALRLSFGTALIAAFIAAALGALLAGALTRYDFPGRRFADALVDLPFALPTAVAGIALTTLYAPNGWLGRPLLALGVKVAYTPLGITLALVFIGLPFVVRTLEPVLRDAAREAEEAAATLGAGRWTILRRVVFPPLRPALLTGCALAFARGVGEYGSVVFIAGNLPGVSEIAPLLIIIRLEEYDYRGASVIAMAMLVVSFGLLIAINALQARMQRLATGEGKRS